LKRPVGKTPNSIPRSRGRREVWDDCMNAPVLKEKSLIDGKDYPTGRKTPPFMTGI